jgi:hypothetical protein
LAPGGSGSVKRASRECWSPAPHPRMIRGVRPAGGSGKFEAGSTLALAQQECNFRHIELHYIHVGRCTFRAAASASQSTRLHRISDSQWIYVSPRGVVREHAWRSSAMECAHPSGRSVANLLARRESAGRCTAPACPVARHTWSGSSTGGAEGYAGCFVWGSTGCSLALRLHRGAKCTCAWRTDVLRSLADG